MLPRAMRCLLPTTAVATSYGRLFKPALIASTRPSEPVPFVGELRMPTILIDAEQLSPLECGTGQPAQRGRRKPIVWKRRRPWFDHQWSLDLQRVKKGPETPHYPDGVPFTQIRSFQSFSGRSWKVNAGRRRKIRLSLKRGRRKLL